MKTKICLVLLLLVSCKPSNIINSTFIDDNNPILFTVDEQRVYADEFIYVYQKNNANNDTAFTKNDIKTYLDLYINFKLKIAEAKALGMDTMPAYHREFAVYKDQLKKPYLTENKVTDQLVKEAYDHYKEEIRASHILLSLPENATPQDTLQAWEKLMGIREKAVAGEDFNTLASTYSDDPSAKINGADLGYFTAFMMVYPFESAAYNTPKGEISMPVRTRFGYHILKVTDRRPAQGSVEVSHIMIKADRQDSLAARRKIFEVYDQVIGGVNWDDLARDFSEDINTKDKGGRLRPFKLGQLPLSFQEAAFSLQNPGDISDPVQSPYGWHIIRLEQRIPLESYEEMKGEIKVRIGKDERSQLNRKALIARLREENGMADSVSDDAVIAWEEAHLSEKYPDYRMLVKEYKEGILLFQLMEDEVWSKATRDTTGLRQYYETHRSDYAKKGPGKQENNQTPVPLNQVRGLVIADYQEQLEKEWIARLKEKYSVDVNKNGLSHVYEVLEKK